MNLFYKIQLQAFSVISIVLYHSGPTFGQVLFSCLDAFVVDASDYSRHLIRHLSASEAFPMEWFLQFWEQVVWWAEPTRLLVPKIEETTPWETLQKH
jgi:homogentisate 1,2-dioxygenase